MAIEKRPIAEIMEGMRAYYNSGITQDVDWRIEQLKKLRKVMKDHQQELLDAMWEDYHKNAFDTWGYELAGTFAEIDDTVRHLKEWAEPKRNGAALFNVPAHSMNYRDPYGVVLVTNAWNFPIFCGVAPLIGAIAGGNCCVFKTSRYVAKTSAWLEMIIAEAFDPNYITVLSGGRDENADLFKAPFDFSFFTGSTTVGSLLMSQQGEHVSPCILELGGKSPTYVDKSANLKEAAEVLAWAKGCNGGQVCVDPDYLMIHEDVYDEFMKLFLDAFRKNDYKNGKLKDGFCGIVSEKHANKMRAFIEPEYVTFGGHYDEANRRLEPTVMEFGYASQDLIDKHLCFQEEIFGTVVPVVKVKSKEDAVDFIHRVCKRYGIGGLEAKPLAFYVYSYDRAVSDYMLAHVQSGGAAINASILHILGTPFNGTGFSGNGDGYHGEESFKVFTHNRTVLVKYHCSGVHRVINWLLFPHDPLNKLIPTLLKTPIDRICQFLIVPPSKWF